MPACKRGAFLTRRRFSSVKLTASASNLREKSGGLPEKNLPQVVELSEKGAGLLIFWSMVRIHHGPPMQQ